MSAASTHARVFVSGQKIVRVVLACQSKLCFTTRPLAITALRFVCCLFALGGLFACNAQRQQQPHQVAVRRLRDSVLRNTIWLEHEEATTCSEIEVCRSLQSP